MPVLLTILFLGAVSVSPTTTAAPQPTAPVAIGPAADETKARQSAEAHRVRGEQLASRGAYPEAAAELTQALRLYRGFPAAERLRMAVVISWGGAFPDALRELMALSKEDPGNLEVRLALARVLSWSGRYREALAETGLVLGREPGNREALLVRANCLRWQGETASALALYRGLVEEREEFDPRVGLAYSFLALGETKRAGAEAARLHPGTPAQKRELEALRNALEAAADQVTPGFSFYRDTDRNQVLRYTLDGATRLGRVVVGASYLHAQATDPVRSDAADSLSLQLTSRPWTKVELAGRLGLTRLSGTADSFYPTGGARVALDIPNGAVGLTAGREMFTDTASIIEHKVSIFDTGVFIRQKSAQRFSWSGSYNYRNYSDANDANDLQLSPAFRLGSGADAPSLGYRLRYLDFRRNSHSGYFDPQHFLSNSVYLAASLERGGWSISLEPSGGYQSFRRNGSGSGDPFGSIRVAMGLRLGEHFHWRLDGEYGNAAVESASGFASYLIGSRLEFRF